MGNIYYKLKNLSFNWESLSFAGTQINIKTLKNIFLSMPSFSQEKDDIDFEIEDFEIGTFYASDEDTVETGAKLIIKRVPKDIEVIEANKNINYTYNESRTKNNKKINLSEEGFENGEKDPVNGGNRRYSPYNNLNYKSDHFASFKNNTSIDNQLPNEKFKNKSSTSFPKKSDLVDKKVNKGSGMDKSKGSGKVFELLCPICQCTPTGATYITCCFFTFCFECIDKYLSIYRKCFVCQVESSRCLLKTNLTIKNLISEQEKSKLKIKKEEVFRPPQRIMQDAEFVSMGVGANSKMAPFVKKNFLAAITFDDDESSSKPFARRGYRSSEPHKEENSDDRRRSDGHSDRERDNYRRDRRDYESDHGERRSGSVFRKKKDDYQDRNRRRMDDRSSYRSYRDEYRKDDRDYYRKDDRSDRRRRW